jgi:hypothetical protein
MPALSRRALVHAWLFPAWPPLNPRQQTDQPRAGLGQGAVVQDRVQAAGQEVAGQRKAVGKDSHRGQLRRARDVRLRNQRILLFGSSLKQMDC